MHFFARHRENIRQSSMSSRLLWPCLLLAALLLLTFGAALFLFASLHNTKKDTTRSLEIQYSVFQNDMERYFDQLAAMGVRRVEAYPLLAGNDPEHHYHGPLALYTGQGFAQVREHEGMALVEKLL